MADFPANGRWTIYSIQKTLPYLGQVGAIFGTHNYLALVDPEGVIDSEMQGVYTGNFVLNGPVPGNYLKVRMYDRGEYIPDQSILSAKPVFVGEEDDLRDLLHSGYREVVQALDATHMLYDGAEIFGHAVNSNSVWYTALRAMGVEDPSQFDGRGSTPGNGIDLRKEPPNNKWFATSQDPWAPNPAFTSRYPKAFRLPPTAEIPIHESAPSEPIESPADELDGAIEEERGQLRQQLRDVDALLSAIDEDALPPDRDVIDGFLDDLNAQLDSLDILNGTDLLDRLRNLVGRLNEWRHYLQGELDADSSLGGVLNFPDDQGNMRDDWQSDEEDGEEWEEQPPTFYPEDELEPELEHAWSEPDAQPRGDEDD